MQLRYYNFSCWFSLFSNIPNCSSFLTSFYMYLIKTQSTMLLLTRRNIYLVFFPWWFSMFRSISNCSSFLTQFCLENIICNSFIVRKTYYLGIFFMVVSACLVASWTAPVFLHNFTCTLKTQSTILLLTGLRKKYINIS